MKAKKYLAIGLIIVTVVSTFLLGVYARDKLNALKATIVETQEQLTQLNEELKNMNEKNNSLEEQIKEFESNREQMQKEYNELNQKYQEEIKPVSYNKYNLKSPSGATVAKLQKALKGTGLAGLEDSYVRAEKEYGVNAIFLVALTAEESAWGRSNRAINQNNMSGFEVYSDSAVGAYFSSKDESIQTTARLLSRDYLSPNGKYHLGYSIYNVNTYYCPVNGTSWSDNISQIANELVQKINSR